jgi:hypothetical protein
LLTYLKDRYVPLDGGSAIPGAGTLLAWGSIPGDDILLDCEGKFVVGGQVAFKRVYEDQLERSRSYAPR